MRVCTFFFETARFIVLGKQWFSHYLPSVNRFLVSSLCTGIHFGCLVALFFKGVLVSRRPEAFVFGRSCSFCRRNEHHKILGVFWEGEEGNARWGEFQWSLLSSLLFISIKFPPWTGLSLLGCRWKRVYRFHVCFGPLLLGHNHPAVSKAIKSVIDRGLTYATLYEDEVRVAEKPCSIVPNCDLIRFGCQGTESTMAAIRIVRGYTGKDKIVKFEGSFSGVHDYVFLGVGGSPGSYAGPPKNPCKNTRIMGCASEYVRQCNLTAMEWPGHAGKDSQTSRRWYCLRNNRTSPIQYRSYTARERILEWNPETLQWIRHNFHSRWDNHRF